MKMNSSIDLIEKLKNAGQEDDDIGLFYKTLDNDSPHSLNVVIRKLTEWLLNPSKTELIGLHFSPWLLEILGWATEIGSSSLMQNAFHTAFTVALSKLVFITDISRFVLNYFQEAPPPFQSITEPLMKEQPIKKRKVEVVISSVSDLEVALATFKLLYYFGSESFSNWNWSPLLIWLNHSSEEVKWLTCLSISKFIKMSEVELTHFITQHVSLKFHIKYSVKYLHTSSKPCYEYKMMDGYFPLSKFTASFERVQLSVEIKREKSNFSLVPLKSTKENLEAIALVVRSGKPVLVEGVVGSGKTCLITYLSSMTRRSNAPYFTKVQLGDQTDSKSLIGTYHCTSNPGEFVWKPGSVTQAVQEGHWLLLEDIDSAPMDVISLLLPLLEERMLPVPGQGSIKAHPNFQLFSTRRLLPSGQRSTGGRANVIEKLWTCISLKTLSSSELIELIETKWPELKEIADKIVEVYLILSSGQHENKFVSSCHECSSNQLTSAKTSGRLVSVRDLVKWCSRITYHVDEKDLDLRAFQEALDCFCAAIPKSKLRFSSAVHIGAHLNLSEATVSHFCYYYKPDIIQKSNLFSVGVRGKLCKQKKTFVLFNNKPEILFSKTRLSCCLLERITVATMNKEPVLLVGETGCGKTSTVQYLAQQTGNELKVINMNQQSDSSDLLGGFKPVDMKTIVLPIRNAFEELFSKTFSVKKNFGFLEYIMVAFTKNKWNILFALFSKTTAEAIKKLTTENESIHKVLKGESDSKDNLRDRELVRRWKKLHLELKRVKEQMNTVQSSLAFSFIEGTLVKAIKEGYWVLLDEINLASNDTLECISGLLDNASGSVTLHEKGDSEPIERHSNFRLFACMNPATDVGKKELTAGLRNRFTEFFVEEFLDEKDLNMLVHDYLSKLNIPQPQIQGIVKFYLKIRKKAEKELTDGTGHKPYFSLRTLCRALSVASKNPCKNVDRSLYESFSLAFLTQLDRLSYPSVINLIKEKILLKKFESRKALLTGTLPCPENENQFVKVGMYWVPKGDQEPFDSSKYIVTSSVRKNLDDLVRIVSISNFPILLQGDTSVGKTSLITYLAHLTGNVCVRINNHQHTDMQEYIGSYAPDNTGKLIFQEGLLVKAMRAGHWIILDELNLAPTDVLEALNRLLDDNRELFIPEIETTVAAHPRFTLFATQNPPGTYGGRQVLSRAFRNRFVELHFDLIPPEELETILHLRCDIPRSYCSKMIAVLHDLQNRRRESNIFQGKQSFISLRDLFRWAERYRLATKQTTKFYDWDQHLADEGYLVLAGRVRLEKETEDVKKVLEKRLNRKINTSNLFNLSSNTSLVTRPILEQLSSIKCFEHIVWTEDMKRLYVLASKALSFCEPVLLVGETGCGKTTVCQMIAAIQNQSLFTVNCHMHTEGSDFLGGLRPIRFRENSQDDRLFEWVDGPLILSMKSGGMLLLDEINLADDSVLERLNSLLEPERTLVLAEKCSTENKQEGEAEIIIAHQDFRLVGTMNPGGDYGKKELSPALRNRFTEIWCPKVEIKRSAVDVYNIIEHNIDKSIILNPKDCNTGLGKAVLCFLKYFMKNELGKKCLISIRDVLSWVSFMNAMKLKCDPKLAYIHGACLILLDSLGSGLTGNSVSDKKVFRQNCMKFLCKQVNLSDSMSIEIFEDSIDSLIFKNDENTFGIEPFMIEKGQKQVHIDPTFAFKAPRTSLNLLRLLRGLQLSRPILLEGSPGVGKTSLVIALAKVTNHDIVRINLSEQTDVSDLFGANLPVEGGESGRFSWRDGPLLQALKSGAWVVFDELNLASQSVLEGLNACFDHRGEIFIPELNHTFYVEHTKTKIFACQNPQYEGGARKGLPKSFLNRFTQIYMETFTALDLEFILTSTYCQLSQDIISKMITFNRLLTEEIIENRLWGTQGGPWEFNLRDLFRWCDIVIQHEKRGYYNPGQFVRLIYGEKMRNEIDKEKIFSLYECVFGDQYPIYKHSGRFFASEECIQIGRAVINRRNEGYTCDIGSKEELYLLHHQLPVLESLIHCIKMNWMAILVGPSGQGKTVLPHLLASLTGQKLSTLSVNSHMDVTELLGGFEQADSGRHLNELLSKIEIIFSLKIRKMIERSQHNSIKSLLSSWFNILKLKQKKQILTPKEEAAAFQKVCDHVISFLVQLKKIPPNCDISELISSCNSIKTRVEMMGKVSGGGNFEWIDSPLVKAVQNGDWLLIDGANLCSASVFDRLNSLLEPNGMLTLDERGSIDGKVPSISPHPNFRLFLALDPQHGEISRAMRNRGIEIYLSYDWLKSPIDLQNILLSSGLRNSYHQEMLLSVHQELSEKLPTFDKPPLSAVTQAAVQIQQLLELGVASDTAFANALDLSYMRRCSNQERKAIVKNVISDVVKNLKRKEDPAPLNEFAYSLRLSNCFLSYNASKAHIHQLSNFFQWKISHFIDKGSLSANILPALFVSLPATFYSEWNYLYVCFSQIGDNELKDVLQLTLKMKFPHFENIDKFFNGRYSSDPRFNILALEKESVESLAVVPTINKALIGLWEILKDTFCRRKKGDIGSKGFKYMTLLQISEAYLTNSLSGFAIYDVCIKYIYPLLKQISSLLISLSTNPDISMNDIDFMKLRKVLHWRDRFEAICDNINKKSFNKLYPELLFYWKMLYRQFLCEIPDEWKSIIPPELPKIISNLKKRFSLQSSLIHDIVPDLRIKLGVEVTLKTKLIASVYQLITKAYEFVVPSLLRPKNNVFLVSDRGYVFKCVIFDLLCDLMKENENIHTTDSLMEDSHAVANIKKNVENLITNTETHLSNVVPTLKSDALLQVMPIKDFLVFKQLSASYILDKDYKEDRDALLAASYFPFDSLFTNSERPHIYSLFMFTKLGTSMANNTKWLNYCSFNNDTEDETPKEIPMEDNVSLSFSSNLLTYQLLVGFFKTGKELESIPIGSYAEREDQIKQIQSTLFKNWYQISNSEMSHSNFLKRTVTDMYKTLLNPLIILLQETLNINISENSESPIAILLKDYSDCFKEIMPILNGIIMYEPYLKKEGSYDREIALLGICLGSLQVWIFSHSDAIDPVIQYRNLADSCLKEKKELEEILLAYKWMDVLRFTQSEDGTHPHIALYKDRLKEIERNLHHHKEYVAYRPCPSQYENIRKDLDHFPKTVFNPSEMLQLAEGISQSSNKKCISLIHSTNTFLNHLVKTYPLYRDIISPLLDAISLVLESMQTLIAVKTVDNHFNELCSRMLSYPYERISTSPLQTLISVCNFQHKALNIIEKQNTTSLFASHSLRAFVYDLVNFISIKGYMDVETFRLMADWINKVMQWWRKEEEERKRKAEEDESLYVYKAKISAISETEEEEIEREYNEWFPSYNDFSDLEDNLEGKKYSETSNESDSVLKITDEHMHEFVELYTELMISTVESGWFTPTKKKIEIDLSNSVILRAQMIQEVLKHFGPIGSEKLDGECIGSFILLNKSILHTMRSKPGANFYLDPLPEEAMKVKSLLTKLEQRIDSLLKEWPSHPLLERIKIVIKRVLGFPLNSPLIRFVVGLETTLVVSQKWEEVAHRGVSLEHEGLSDITLQVIAWRKSELKSWKSYLEMVSKKVSSEAYKLWPHLNESLMHIKEENICEFIKTLKQFMELSLIGDYEVRLKLLLASHNLAYMMLESSSEESERNFFNKVVAIIWNIYGYYSQFSLALEQILKDSKKPIEKELKQFIKISQWKDTNFFSVQKSVQKSKRTLHSHMRQWEKIIRQSASSFFRDQKRDVTDSTDKGISLSHALPTTDIKLQHEDTNPQFPDIVTEGNSLMTRSSLLYKKCSTFISEMEKSFPYEEHFDCISELTTDMISKFQDFALATARLDNINDKENKISQTKSLIHQKRESLSSLLKILGNLGVSYTKGNSIWKENSLDEYLFVPPVAVCGPGATDMNKMFKRGEPYFFKSLSRQAVLTSSLEQPHKDIGPELIKRLNGTSRFFILNMLRVRNAIPKVVTQTVRLRNTIVELENANEEVFPHSNDFREFWRLIESHLLSLTLTVNETEELLSSYTDKDPLILIAPGPTPLSQEIVANACTLLKDIGKVTLNAIEAHKNKFRLSTTKESVFLASEINIRDLIDAVEATDNIADKVESCLSILNSNKEQALSFTNPLKDWIQSWKENILFKFDKWFKSLNPSKPESCLYYQPVEDCIKYSLLCIENFYKKYCEGKNESTNDEGLPKDLISKCITGSLLEDVKNLNILTVTNAVDSLARSFEENSNLNKISSLNILIPFVKKYLVICERVSHFLLSTFTIVGKFQCSLLAIFNELALKGYCRPQDIENETGEGSGEMTFEDSGPGMADGEGKKDVSERFESEDQLESALQEGEKEKEANEDVEEDEGGVEMNRDFEGKMQDIKDHEDEEENDDDDQEEENELDDQMGETEKGAEKLDERLWGDEEEEQQKEDQETKDGEEEDGPGMDKEESEIVANEDNKSKKERKEKEEKKEKKELEVMEEDRRKPNEPDDEEGNYDDNFTDKHTEENPPLNEEEEEEFNLPEDLNLDEGEKEDADEEGNTEELMPEIEEKELFPEKEKEPKQDGDKDDNSSELEETENENNTNEFEEEEEGKADGTEKEELDKESTEMEVEDIEESKTEQATPSNDQETKEKAEVANMDSVDASKDQTKEKLDSKSGCQAPDENEEEQRDQGKTGEDTDDVTGLGESDSHKREDAHKGLESTLINSEEGESRFKPEKKPRKPGNVDENKTMGDSKEKIDRGLLTKQARDKKNANDNEETDKEMENNCDAMEYQHIGKENSHYDKQTVDAATLEQAKKLPAPTEEEEKPSEEEVDGINDALMEVEEEIEEIDEEQRKRHAEDISEEPNGKRLKAEGEDGDEEDVKSKLITEGEVIQEMVMERPNKNDFYTLLDEEEFAPETTEEDLIAARESIKEADFGNQDLGIQQWTEVEDKVTPLSLQLCEELRLILEPTEAAKLKGDYRTGKRLNMRKVIPYIASNFRKDKIWLRRLQPNKRSYQVLIAVDDSQSMERVQASRMAREGVAIVAKALNLLEVGQVGVVRFGEDTKILHSLNEPFSDQAGAKIFSNLNFAQQKSNFATMLKNCVALLSGARGVAKSDHAQLLLILSDGQIQGYSNEVKEAVRAARHEKIFVVFLVLDVRDNKYSFYDTIVWEEISPGKLKSMSIVETFPFPFFLVIRDLSGLPESLSTALRQWFELITSDVH